MDAPLPTNYDEVAYPGRAQVATHPDRLATIAALLGLEAAPVQRCRVLELGCGDGTNLLAMACTLPESEFLGIDGAARPIATGTQVIAELGLTNVRLEQHDLLEFGEAAGTFDYIITHGVYSWVPPVVRDRILAISAKCLAPNGIAYISYNAYPGCHIRDMARRMMLYHVRDIDDAGQKVVQGRALLKFLSTSKTETDIYRTILNKELAEDGDFVAGAFYHDDLNPLNQPFYFHEFIEHAAQHGLQFLAEAILNEFDPNGYTPATMAKVRELDADPIAREQYLDFLMCRRFRRTLLCRQDVPLDYQIDPGAITRLYAALDAQPVSPNPNLRSPKAEAFRTVKGASVETNRPLHKAALWHLSQRWPERVPFAELLATSLRLSETPAADDEKEATISLCELLLRTYVAGVAELHVWAPPFVTTVSERPVASAFARLESKRGTRVSTLRHVGLDLEDVRLRRLFGLLDGTRDSNALIEALAAMSERGVAQSADTDAPVTDPAQIREMLAKAVPEALKSFARAAVLVG